MAGVKIVSLLLVCMVMAAPTATDAAITCGTVVGLLRPCLLQNNWARPWACCAGIRSLNAQAKTTLDRQTTCGCLKRASGGVNVALAASLPDKCGVNIPYKISPSTDCSKLR